MAARSDYGDDDEDDQEVNGGPGGDETANGGKENGEKREKKERNGDGDRRGSINPALLNDPEKVKARSEADKHLHSYISQQLERVKLERGDDYENLEGDEYVTKA